MWVVIPMVVNHRGNDGPNENKDFVEEDTDEQDSEDNGDPRSHRKWRNSRQCPVYACWKIGITDDVAPYPLSV